MFLRPVTVSMSREINAFGRKSLYLFICISTNQMLYLNSVNTNNAHTHRNYFLLTVASRQEVLHQWERHCCSHVFPAFFSLSSSVFKRGQNWNRFGTSRVWVNDDRFVMFGWTVPLKAISRWAYLKIKCFFRGVTATEPHPLLSFIKQPFVHPHCTIWGFWPSERSVLLRLWLINWYLRSQCYLWSQSAQ